MDPQWILGGSNVNSRDPATLSPVKIGGSGGTTSPLYNIKRGQRQWKVVEMRCQLAPNIRFNLARFCYHFWPQIGNHWETRWPALGSIFGPDFEAIFGTQNWYHF